MRKAKAVFMVFISLWLGGCVTQMAYQQTKDRCDSCPPAVTDDAQEQWRERKADAALMQVAIAADAALFSFTSQAVATTVRDWIDADPTAAASSSACGAAEVQVCSINTGCWCEPE